MLAERATRFAASAWRAGARRRQQRGESAVIDLASTAGLTRVWEAEHNRIVYARDWPLRN